MNDNVTFDCDFPVWALNYLINGDSTGLTPEEIATVDKWCEHKGFFSTEEGEYFSWYPQFGLPCTCETVFYKYTEDFEEGEGN